MTSYRDYLYEERRRFAWVLIHVGGYTREEAKAAAKVRYPYESSRNEYRWLIFHQEAWQWAMIHLHGHMYWIDRPELNNPPSGYDAVR